MTMTEQQSLLPQAQATKNSSAEMPSSTPSRPSDAGQSAPASATDVTAATDHRLMHRLWQRMFERYGERWSAVRGERWDGAQWLAEIGHMSADQIARGLQADAELEARAARDGRQRYAPTAREFWLLATQASRTRPAKGARTKGLGEAWLAYQQFFGLRPRRLSNDEIHAALDGHDVERFHEQVRARLLEAGMRPERVAQWPWEIAAGRGVQRITP